MKGYFKALITSIEVIHLLKQLEEVREELLRLIEDLTDEQANRKVIHDGWTIVQVLDHLVRTEQAVAHHILTVKHQEVSKDSIKKRPVHLILKRDKRASVQFSSLTPREEFQTLSSLCNQLKQTRGSLIHAIDQIGMDQLVSKAAEHPIFGTISLAQYVEIVYLHEERHIEQIIELLRKIK